MGLPPLAPPRALGRLVRRVANPPFRRARPAFPAQWFLGEPIRQRPVDRRGRAALRLSNNTTLPLLSLSFVGCFSGVGWRGRISALTEKGKKNSKKMTNETARRLFPLIQCGESKSKANQPSMRKIPPHFPKTRESPTAPKPAWTQSQSRQRIRLAAWPPPAAKLSFPQGQDGFFAFFGKGGNRRPVFAASDSPSTKRSLLQLFVVFNPLFSSFW